MRGGLKLFLGASTRAPRLPASKCRAFFLPSGLFSGDTRLLLLLKALAPCRACLILFQLPFARALPPSTSAEERSSSAVVEGLFSAEEAVRASSCSRRGVVG